MPKLPARPTKKEQPAPATVASTGFWLVKQEPTSYSWSQFVQDGKTAWTGVRNFQARNNLLAMRRGDQVFYYHSVIGKEVVGIAKVVKVAYADPTASEGDWKAVDLQPVRPLKTPVTLEAIKADPRFQDLLLVRHSRISVVPMTEKAFHEIVALGA